MIEIKITENQELVLNALKDGTYTAAKFKGGALQVAALVDKGLAKYDGEKIVEVVTLKPVKQYSAVEGVEYEIGTSAKPRENKGNSKDTVAILEFIQNATVAMSSNEIAEKLGLNPKSVQGSLLSLSSKGDVSKEARLVGNKRVVFYNA